MTIRIDKCLLSVHLIPFFSGHIKNRCDHRPHGKSFKLIVGLRFLSWSHLNRCDHSCDHHLTTCATCTKIVLSAGVPPAIHAAQIYVYSPKEQGSALLLTRLAAPPARPYPFHGRMTVELLENTGTILLYPFSIQFPAIYDNFIFFSACKISQYVFLLCNSRHYIPFRSEHIIPVCKPLGFFLVQCP